jgi:predicted nucleotidyltransferase
MTLSLEQVRQRRADIHRIAADHGARNVRIFGSLARGEAGPASDVDVLVVFEPGRSLLDLIGLQQDLTDLLRCKVDVVSEGALEREDRILTEAVAL